MGKAKKIQRNIDSKRESKSDYIEAIRSLKDDSLYSLSNNGKFLPCGQKTWLTGRKWKEIYNISV